MMTGLFLLLLASAQEGPSLSVEQRCSLVATILHVPAKQVIRDAGRPQVVDTPFLQVEVVRTSATRRGRAIVRPLWQIKKRTVDMFAVGESCNYEAFVLERADPDERQVRHEPRGTSDHVVVVTVGATSTSQVSRFRFEETLGLSLHSRSPGGMEGGGGYAVPSTKYSGTVERSVEGKWQAKVIKALFAS
jgi:hypothetical protein